MRRPAFVAAGLAAAWIAAIPLVARQGSTAPPAWAYGLPPAGASVPQGQRGAAPPDDGSPKHLDGSARAFTLAELRDGFTIADWFPTDHPAPPAIVLTGRAPNVRACGLCHYPNGRGRPENAGIAGLPAVYFIQQMADFKGDRRKSAEPRKTNTALMATIAKGLSDDEIRSAAEYFASMTWTPWIKVVETATVPTTRAAGGLFVPIATGQPGAGSEAIGSRIIEVPEHPDRTDLRDPRAGFIAYVPIGSIARGQTLANGEAGKTLRCSICHGDDLKGLGPVPGLAGRSPSYEARQLFDMRAGTRRGVWTDLMHAVVANLSDDDVLALAAYAASR